MSLPDRRQVILGGLAVGLAGPGAAQSAPGKIPRPEVAFTMPAIDPRVGTIVDQVDQGQLRQSVTGLTSFATRWSGSAQFPQVEDWLAARFEINGGTTTRQPFALPSVHHRNNILWGDPTDPRGVILVGAHFDSTSETPAAFAPGANDNASGTAAMLEALRILSLHRFQHEIVFAGFAGEEQGLIGSTACADVAMRESWPIRLMVNLDMLGNHPEEPSAPIYIEYDQGNATSANDAAARGFALMAAGLTAEHTTLNTEHTDIWDSDYMPFEEAGFPCIGFYDGGVAAPEYHSTRDQAERLDFGRLEQVTRALLATVATAAVLV